MTQLNGLPNSHLNGALVVFRRRQGSQFAVAIDEPKGSGNDADANRRVTRFEALKGGHGYAQALCPRPQGLLAAQASHS
ncbi:MAG: hypothetical protein IT518_06045 [Burkholderiales bacterium]|nr:hypothetical protein [Burkholderiales bacterium]